MCLFLSEKNFSKASAKMFSDKSSPLKKQWNVIVIFFPCETIPNPSDKCLKRSIKEWLDGIFMFGKLVGCGTDCKLLSTCFHRERVLLKWFFFHTCLRLLHSVPVNLCVDFKTFEKLKFSCKRDAELPNFWKSLPNQAEIPQIYSNAFLDLIIYYHLRRLARNLNFNLTFGNDKWLENPTQTAK